MCQNCRKVVQGVHDVIEAKKIKQTDINEKVTNSSKRKHRSHRNGNMTSQFVQFDIKSDKESEVKTCSIQIEATVLF